MIPEAFVFCVRAEQREDAQATDAEADRLAFGEMKTCFCCGSCTFYYSMITKLWRLLIPGFCSSPGRSRPARCLFGLAGAGPLLPLSWMRLRPCCFRDLIRASFVPQPPTPASSCSRFRRTRTRTTDSKFRTYHQLLCLLLICRFWAGCSSDRQGRNHTHKILIGLCFGSVHHFLNHSLISAQSRQGAHGSWLCVLFFLSPLLDENTQLAKLAS